MKLQKMQAAYLIDLEDAVVAVKNAKGKIKLHQPVNMTALGMAGGGFWGALMGMLFLMPILGIAVGATMGAVSGALRDVGISDTFMKDPANTMKPNTSALFVLVRKATPDRVMEELKGTGGQDSPDIAVARRNRQAAEHSRRGCINTRCDQQGEMA